MGMLEGRDNLIQTCHDLDHPVEARKSAVIFSVESSYQGSFEEALTSILIMQPSVVTSATEQSIAPPLTMLQLSHFSCSGLPTAHHLILFAESGEGLSKESERRNSSVNLEFNGARLDCKLTSGTGRLLNS